MLLPILRQIEQKTLVERSACGLRAAAGVSFGASGVGIFPEFVRSNHTGGRRRRLRLPLMLSMGKLGQGELPAQTAPQAVATRVEFGAACL